MKNSEKRKQKIKNVILISSIGTFAGLIFTVSSFGFDEVHALKGITAGFVITFLIAIFENFVFIDKFKKLKFSSVFLTRSLVYVFIISFAVISVWVIHESRLNNVNIFTTLGSSDFEYFIINGDFKYILLFAVIFSFTGNFVTQINNLLGKNVLLNYITGKYHNPKEEERAFMFLDLSSSTTIAEKLGPVNNHKFINSFFFDIDEEIVESKGQVYQYVGDEVVISWKDNSGFKDSDCVKCFFRIRDKIERLSGNYRSEFGIIPEFKAGLHFGLTITGEIGDSKKEIVFHGDVLNTASRIMSQCNELKKTFLISEEILSRVKLPDEFRIESLGEFKLRGKEQEVKLFNVERI
ncbi:MAG TPA: adenylate/guanylate cyclase domain-containing protein [Ignavibacteria bacterium]|nr:adenylate/guanylate cyclase domain-containing protein [Ignavibacteria bacterium]